MQSGRIFFKGNPWPEGHPIKTFKWTALAKGWNVYFSFHLETEHYESEREYDIDNDDTEYETDWEAPIAWSAYHHCILSSDDYHNGEFKVCRRSKFRPEYFDGFTIKLDEDPGDIGFLEDRHFHIYLQGHDATAFQNITFRRVAGTNLFNIAWTGRIALAYVGEEEYKYEFEARINGVPFPKLNI